MPNFPPVPTWTNTAPLIANVACEHAQARQASKRKGTCSQ